MSKRYWKQRIRKRVTALLGLVMLLVIGSMVFTGCRRENEQEEKLEDLEFTVVGERDTPERLREMITQKKTAPFKLTYTDGQDMYIVIGEGPQKGGGFSIIVNELYRTENSLVIETELLGPEKGMDAGTEESYPVLIVKTGCYEEPVVFQ